MTARTPLHAHEAPVGQELPQAPNWRGSVDSTRDDRCDCLWRATTPNGQHYSSLDGDCSADVVVIGGGFTGFSAALELRRAGTGVMILEAAEPGWGASGRNSGLVIPTLTRADPDDIVARYGASGERFVLLLRDSAERLFQTARDLGLGNLLEQKGWLQPAHTIGRMALIERRAAQWAKWGAPVEIVDPPDLEILLGSAAWHGALLNRSGGTINPLALIDAMAAAAHNAGAVIHGQTPALTVQRSGGRWLVATPRGLVRARALLIATNAYTGAFSRQLAPDIARETIPLASWLVATEPLTEIARRSVIPSRMAMSDTRGDLYFARYDAQHRLISGGALLNPIRTASNLKALVRDRIGTLWPQINRVKIDFVWNGLIGITSDRFPRFHQLGQDAFAWTGCNGRGVALSVAVGKELARALMGATLADIALPFTSPAPLPAYALLRLLAPLALLSYRRRDAREIGRGEMGGRRSPG